MSLFYNGSGLPDDKVELTFEHFEGSGSAAVFRVYVSGDDNDPGVFFEADASSQFDIIARGLDAWDEVHRG
jgi:hypothetical protein